jgi:hypothetical protein
MGKKGWIVGFWGGDFEDRYGEQFMGKKGWIVGFWGGDFGGDLRF